MKKTIRRRPAGGLCSSATAAKVDGWILSGARAGSYEIGEDTGEGGSKRIPRFIRYTGGDASSFGTLMQQISAKNYAGKRDASVPWSKRATSATGLACG
jgi:hypothetical protein